MLIQRVLGVWFVVSVLSGGGEPFARDAEEGIELRRSFSFDYELELDELEFYVDGEQLPGGEGVGVTLESERSVIVEDEYGPSAGDRPQRLVRYFHELVGETTRTVSEGGGGGEQSHSIGSELEGVSVVFALDLDQEGYALSFEDEGGDDELLEGLLEDMDLRAFLPEEGAELDVGDAYELPAELFLALARPGGIALVAGDNDELRREASKQLADNLEGEILATYRGMREVDGSECAVLELDIDVTSAASQRVPTDSEAEVRVGVEFAYRLGGELLWNGADGHLMDLDLEGEIALVERNQMTLESSEREQVLRYSGDLTATARIERID